MLSISLAMLFYEIKFLIVSSYNLTLSNVSSGIGSSTSISYLTILGFPLFFGFYISWFYISLGGIYKVFEDIYGII